MKAIRYWMLALMAAGVTLIPLQSASAWDYSGGGYRGGGYGGYHGGHYGSGYYSGYHGHRGYYGNYRGGGCRGCDAVGAGIVGLAIGTIIGSAMIEASRPPVVVQSPRPPSRSCASVIVEGVTYYNCGYNRRGYYEDW